MEPCARRLRHHADAVVKPDAPTRHQSRLREKILTVGLSLLAAYGRASITASRLALALNIQTSTLRRHFIDMDELVAELIMEELRRLSTLLAAIPADTPDRQAACRAAWLAATRRLGSHTEAHTLVVRDLPFLPDDLRAPLEHTLLILGRELAGDHAEDCLALLALPRFGGQVIEAMLAALPAAAEPPGPVPDTAASAPPPEAASAPPPEAASLPPEAATSAPPATEPRLATSTAPPRAETPASAAPFTPTPADRATLNWLLAATGTQESMAAVLAASRPAGRAPPA